MSRVKLFKVGDKCVHEGIIYRVEAVERKFAKGLTHMGVKDGTEFNPTLTLIPMYGRDGEPVKAGERCKESAGAVRSVTEEIREMKAQMEIINKKMQILTGN